MRIAIIGGGLGGLSLARTLQQRELADATVTIYEQNDGVLARGGGIFMTYGAAVLDKLGLRENFLAVANSLYKFQLNSDGNVVVDREQTKSPMQFQVLRQNLQQLLFDSVKDMVRFNAKVESIEESDEGVKIVFSDGTVEEADLVVGADGIRSTVCNYCFEDVGEPVWTGYQMLYSLTDKHVRKDPSLVTSCYSAATDSDTGRSERFYKFSFTIGSKEGSLRKDVCCITRQAKEPMTNAWDSTILVEEMQDITKHAFSDNHDNCHEIVDNALRVFSWGIYEAPIRPTWISAKSKVVLLGDAAHATSPFAGQGGNQAMVDGYCLGTFLADALEQASGEDSDLRSALSKYEKTRKAPTEKIMKSSKKIANMHFMTGWRANARNVIMKAANMFIPEQKPFDKETKLW